MDECARVNRFPRLSSKRRGFDFGFGSLNDTEYMCRYGIILFLEVVTHFCLF
uniref:Uncharacterized protein n=1 Tax=Mesocestoides corti TaxID=53468 RepID=A0A5K3FR07_MESCO